jgi:hypothetical protein
MYIDIPPNDNTDPAMATFKETGPGTPVRAVKLHLPDGQWSWCAVTGWSDNGPVPALLTPIEESGDGPARLFTGGDHGLRLARINTPEDAARVRWDLADGRQWGEPFLLNTPDVESAT